MMEAKDIFARINQNMSNVGAFCLAAVILIYAASGPIGELVQWIIQSTTADWDELSRRDKRILLKTHWLAKDGNHLLFLFVRIPQNLLFLKQSPPMYKELGAYQPQKP